MSDINLLPMNERSREWKEIRKKIEEKATTIVELSNPQQKKSFLPAPKTGNLPSLSWLERIKSWWQGRHKEPELKKIVPTPAPSIHNIEKIPEHQGETKPMAPHKMFFQQTPRMADSIMANGNGKKDNGVKPSVAMPVAPAMPLEKLFVPKVPAMPVVAEKMNTIPVVKNSSLITEHQPLAEEKSQRVDINLIPEQKKSSSTKQKNIFGALMALVICLVLIGDGYVGLSYLIANQEQHLSQLTMEAQETESEINELKQLSAQANDFINLLRAVKQMLNKHGQMTPVFTFLQSYTMRDVYYTQAQVDSVNYSVLLNVNAKDYKTVSEQLFVFQSLPEQILAMEVSNMELKKIENANPPLVTLPVELVNFNLVLKFKPEFFLSIK